MNAAWMNRWLALLACWALLGAAPAWASTEKANAQAKKNSMEAIQEAPRPYINYIFPAGGRRGQTVEVLISGTNLAPRAATTQVRLLGGGASARLLDSTNPSLVRVAIAIEPNAAPGPRELRILTRGGASNLSRFIVGELPEINEVEPNNDKAQAQKLAALPVTINGQIKQGDRDFYRFSAKAGQSLVCAVAAQSLVPFIADAVPGWNDPCLTLYNADGKKIITVDDFQLHPDPVLFCEVKKDGDYLLEITDSIARGRDDFVYRLTVGEIPFITSIYPLGGQRGQEIEATLQGVNLPAKTIRLAIPSNTPAIWPVTVTNTVCASNPRPLATDSLPEVNEQEPNNTLEQATKITWPCTVNGRIDKPGDVDWFSFKVEAGQKLILEIRARRLESPLDSVLTLFNGKGGELAENDDTVDPAEPLMTHHADSKLAYTFKAAGRFFVRVRDAQGKGGADFAYRLRLAPPQPDFTLRVTPDNPRMGQGDTALLLVSALRRDDFTNEIAVNFADLPPGYQTSSGLLLTNQDETPVTITSPRGAAPGLFFPVVNGTASVEGSDKTVKAVPAESMMQAFSYIHLVPTKDLLLTVTEPPPISLSISNLSTNRSTLSLSNSLELTVKASRQEGLRGPVVITALKPPAGILVKAVTIPPEKDEATVVVTINTNKPPVVGFRQNLILQGILRQGKAGLAAIAPAIPITVVADKE